MALVDCGVAARGRARTQPAPVPPDGNPRGETGDSGIGGCAMTTREIESYALAWQRRLRTRESLFSLGTSLALGAVVLLVAPNDLRWWLALVVSVIAFLVTYGFRLSKADPQRIDASALARHLDRTHAGLEESSALWLRAPESLS